MTKTIRISNDLLFSQVCELLDQGNEVAIKLVGSSMHPLLRNGKDSVLLSPLPSGYTCRKGDVVLFRYQGRHLLHRIIGQTPDGQYILQGDNSLLREYAPPNDILALLVAVRRNNRRQWSTQSTSWRVASAFAGLRRQLKTLCCRCFNTKGRKYLTPIYFLLLAFLMWAPINGTALRLNNFILGIRIDHLFHASIFLLCAFFLMDILRYRPLPVLLLSVAIALTTESVQYLLPFRAFDVNDLLANFIGVTLGWLVIQPYIKRKRASLRQNSSPSSSL